jgi:hypothetical protein
MISPSSVIIEFGRERSGDKAGQLAVGIRRNRVTELSDTDLRNLQNLIRQSFEIVVREEFRRIKEAKTIIDTTPAVIT